MNAEGVAYVSRLPHHVTPSGVKNREPLNNQPLFLRDTEFLSRRNLSRENADLPPSRPETREIDADGDERADAEKPREPASAEVAAG